MDTLTEIMIIAGTPGAGKSSFLGILQGTCEWLPDIADEDMIDGSGVAVQEKICTIIRDYVRWELPLTVKTAALEAVIPGLQFAKSKGYKIKLYYVGISTLEECIARTENKARRGKRTSSSQTVECCYRNRWRELRKLLPLCDEAAFFDNENGFLLIGRYLDDSLVPEEKKMPQWWQEMVDYIEKGE